MAKVKDVRWGRWVGAVAGAVVLVKSGVFVTAKLFGLAKSEVQHRGRDVEFVLGLAERRKSGRA